MGVIGSWRIVEMDLWDRDALDLLGPASGRGWAAPEEDGSLVGHIYFHLGDDSDFRARRGVPESRASFDGQKTADRPGPERAPTLGARRPTEVERHLRLPRPERSVSKMADCD